MVQPPHKLPHILFLFSDTGGGHRSAAEAIIEAINLEFPGQVTTEMVDIFRQYAPRPLNHAPDIYPVLTRLPHMWALGYRVIDGRYRVRNMYYAFWPYVRTSMQRLLRERPSDLVVSVHQLPNFPIVWAMGRYPRRFVTVVTDMVTTHAAWFNPRANLVIVPTDQAKERALGMGMKPEKVRVVGMPVADRFTAPLGDRKALREKFGWPQDQPVVLMVGGGDGMGPLGATVKATDAAGLPAHLAVVCGRNEHLLNDLKAHRWQVGHTLYGFVRDMPDMMRAADVIITKAGPGTISEAFIAGLPIILYSRLPGQEDGNVSYVVNEGAGVWAPEPDRVVETLRIWLQNPSILERVAAASHRLARPQATRQIAHLLLEQMGITK
jgi:1,2-diacylglycerol 3-beta-galactosyltransferase